MTTADNGLDRHVGYSARFTNYAGFTVEGTVTCTFSGVHGDTVVLTEYDRDGNYVAEHEVPVSNPTLEIYG